MNKMIKMVSLSFASIILLTACAGQTNAPTNTTSFKGSVAEAAINKQLPVVPREAAEKLMELNSAKEASKRIAVEGIRLENNLGLEARELREAGIKEALHGTLYVMPLPGEKNKVAEARAEEEAILKLVAGGMTREEAEEAARGLQIINPMRKNEVAKLVTPEEQMLRMEQIREMARVNAEEMPTLKLKTSAEKEYEKVLERSGAEEAMHFVAREAGRMIEAGSTSREARSEIEAISREPGVEGRRAVELVSTELTPDLGRLEQEMELAMEMLVQVRPGAITVEKGTNNDIRMTMPTKLGVAEELKMSELLKRMAEAVYAPLKKAGAEKLLTGVNKLGEELVVGGIHFNFGKYQNEEF